MTNPKECQVLILSQDSPQLETLALPQGLEPEELRAAQFGRFCKGESHPEYFLGTLHLPALGKHRKCHRLAFALWEGHLLLLDQNGFGESAFHRLARKGGGGSLCAGRLLHDFLSLFLADDLRHLESIEKEITDLENQVLSGKLDGFNRTLVNHRKEIMTLAHYYSQMADLAEELLQNENRFFSPEELRLFGLLENRLLRLKEETYLLREYSLQIREVYQAQLDLRQNSIMQTLTIVTTIFLPLSLIAGWYGMNFSHMPELSWKYGYPVIAAVSGLVVLFCIWLFKRKKYL